MEKILKKSFENLKEHFKSLLLLVLVQVTLISIVEKIFNLKSYQTYIFDMLFNPSKFILLFGSLIVALLSAIIVDYSYLETYLSFKENREPRAFGVFKLFLEYDTELLKLSILKSIKVFLWSLLFIIPGIMKYYEYKRVLISKTENYNLSTKECFAKSKYEMEGRRFELFGYEFIIVILNVLFVYLFTLVFGNFFINSLITFSEENILISSILIFIFSFISKIITTIFFNAIFGTFNIELTKFLKTPNEEGMFKIEYEEENSNKEDL